MSRITPQTRTSETLPLSMFFGTATPSATQQAEALVEARIGAAVDAWLDATCTLSSLDDIRRDKYYQILKTLGWPVVATLLARIRQQRARLQCAELLTDITGEDPVSPADYGRADRIGGAWLKWGVSKGFI